MALLQKMQNDAPRLTIVLLFAAQQTAIQFPDIASLNPYETKY
jgi:hypothetical protein